MTYKLIERSDWVPFISSVSKLVHGQLAEVEIIGLDIGDQIEKDWTTIDGISYDDLEDVLYVHRQPFNYEIRNPEKMFSAEEGLVMKMLTIQDNQDHLQIIHFREPLRLEAAREPKDPFANY